MAGLDFTNASIHLMITHHIGNKMKEGTVMLTDDLTVVDEEDTMHFAKTYFLQKFKPYNIQQFHHSTDIELNEVYSMVKTIFNDQLKFIPTSKDLAHLLFAKTEHPMIKDGEMSVVYFNDINLDGELFDAIGIFKSESNTPFLQMLENQGKYSMQHDFGYPINSLDKGCLIFNTEEETGYNVLAIDNTNGPSEAIFWVKQFLKLAPIDDDYNNTHSFLQATKHFVSDNLAGKASFGKKDEIDLLDKTMDYFKTHDSFEKKDFAEVVLQTPELIETFEEFDRSIPSSMALKDNFDISNQAVKTQSKIYKSILKLDKNFHVYIHGDRSKIQRGVDEEGRKFYKIYFDTEM